VRLSLLLLALLVTPAYAGTLVGVTHPEQITVEGNALLLNGQGVRKKYFLSIYVGSLYLKSKTTDAAKAIHDDAPKRLVMHFLYAVDKDKLVATYNEGLSKQNHPNSLKERYDKLYGMLGKVNSGEEIAFEYVPGRGTTVSVKGQNKGTIAGVDFMRSLFQIYLGDSPPTADLKKGMLGG
jgi:hypothetical protein